MVILLPEWLSGLTFTKNKKRRKKFSVYRKKENTNEFETKNTVVLEVSELLARWTWRTHALRLFVDAK